MTQGFRKVDMTPARTGESRFHAMTRRLVASPLLLGVIVGLLFGSVNLLATWLDPLQDDTPATLLLFYGPMFSIWALVSFLAARRTGRFSSGVTTGVAVAFATFCLFEAFIVLRVNLFLERLTDRVDWQRLMARFLASGDPSLRSFVNLEYLRGAPLKIATASAIGGIMGALGGSAGWLKHRRAVRTA
jgi:hypothetical protein